MCGSTLPIQNCLPLSQVSEWPRGVFTFTWTTIDSNQHPDSAVDGNVLDIASALDISEPKAQLLELESILGGQVFAFRPTQPGSPEILSGWLRLSLGNVSNVSRWLESRPQLKVVLPRGRPSFQSSECHANMQP